MKLNKLFIILFAATFLFFIGCEKDDDTTTLNDYLVENSLDLPNILDGWITTATNVHDNLADYYVIDTRSESAYNAGHIPGAVWASSSTLLDVAANNGGKQIVVHCYKGIGAAPKLVALRLSGYLDAQNMKFGMSAWGPSDHADSVAAGKTSGAYDKWTSACANIALDYPADWLTTASTPAADVEYDYPAIATKEVEDGADFLAERVDSLLSAGFGYASAPSILTDREDYFINNKWDEASWNKYGHIAGAHRINDIGIENGGISKYDPDATCVTYCWTSQTSGVIAAYLTVLGYEAQSLSKGANGLIYSNLESHAWGLGEGVNAAVTVTPGANAPGDYTLE